MRAAVINNGRNEPKNTLKLLSNFEVDLFTPETADQVVPEEYDLIQLTGSSHLTVMHDEDILEKELELIRRSTTPILGVCFGFQLLVRAFGGTLRKMEHEALREVITLRVTEDSALFCGKDEYKVYDAHRWVVDTFPEEFDILGVSDHGPEIIKHRERPLYGFQFHPEKMLEESEGKELFDRFLELEVLKS